jgi:hypothetical protein
MDGDIVYYIERDYNDGTPPYVSHTLNLNSEAERAPLHPFVAPISPQPNLGFPVFFMYHKDGVYGLQEGKDYGPSDPGFFSVDVKSRPPIINAFFPTALRRGRHRVTSTESYETVALSFYATPCAFMLLKFDPFTHTATEHTLRIPDALGTDFGHAGYPSKMSKSNYFDFRMGIAALRIQHGGSVVILSY